jgi:hypothetical protein
MSQAARLYGLAFFSGAAALAHPAARKKATPTPFRACMIVASL